MHARGNATYGSSPAKGECRARGERNGVAHRVRYRSRHGARDAGADLRAVLLDESPAHGSGLGLATTFGIVGRAGGSITAESVPGEGSRFSIRLPLSASDETIADPALRELERVLLAEGGYRVLAAGSGPEALVAVGCQRPDIVLVDMVLPGMSGPELVEELAARGSDVPIIFVSGQGSDELASRPGRLPALRQRRLDDRRVIAGEMRARCSPAARGRTWKRFAT